MKMKRRLLSILMILCMMVSLVPGNVLAEDWESAAAEAEESVLTADETESVYEAAEEFAAAENEEEDAPAAESEEEDAPAAESEEEDAPVAESEEEDALAVEEEGDDLSEEAPDPVNSEDDADVQEEESVAVMASEGSCGEDVTWTLDAAGVLVISGTGPMDDYDYRYVGNYEVTTAPWGESEFNAAVIEPGVTTIGSYAFCGCSGLTDVTIADSVTTIGNYAFTFSDLTSVTIPDSVTIIGHYAFYGCSDLTDVTIPDSVTGIGVRSFYSCSSLTCVTIPGSVASIGYYAFYGCSSLTSVTIMDGVASIGDSAFSNCSSLSTITMEGDIPSIGSSAFTDVTATVFYPGGNATYTSDNMLNYGGSLTWTVYQMIVSSGICGDNLTWTLDDHGLLTISGTGDMTNYSGIGSISPAPWGTDIMSAKDIKTVRIEQGVTSIGNNAFLYCSNLTSVTIPASVASIGEYAFYGCENMTSVTIPESVMSIGAFAFSHCSSLASVTIPDRVTIIEDGAFSDCSSLTSVTIPAGVTSIGEFAFQDCSSLTSVTIPDTVTSIGRGAFGSCSSLTSVTIPASVTSIGYQAFSVCDSLTSIIVADENPEYASVEGILYNKNRTRLITVPGGYSGDLSILPGVTNIGDFAFGYCGKLTSVTIPESVTSIEHDAFLYCSRLRTIRLEGDMPNVDSTAFTFVRATVRYPEGNATYTTSNMLGYGGTLTWKAIPYWSGLPEELTLDRGYLLLNMSSDEVTLETNLTYPAHLAHVNWTTESGTEDVISVSGGTVTVNAPGTDYVVATLSTGERTMTARCRIDVLDEEKQEDRDIFVVLPETQVSIELFKTDYSRFSVVLRLEQNVKAADVTVEKEVELGDTGVAITGAEFVGGGKQDILDAFRLRVVDDRTLEIIPIIDLDDSAEVKKVAKSYKSSVRLTLSNGQILTTPELTVKVAKTLPKLKAAAVKLNSFIDSDTAPVIVTGGRVKSFTSSADAKTNALATLNSDLTVAVNGTGVKGSGKFNLSCELEDWAVDANVTVPVSVTYTTPKATLKPASVTLNSDIDDCAETAVTLVPLAGMSHSITVDSVSGLSAVYDEATGKIVVRSGSAAPGTYKVPVKADGKQVAVLTVKVLPKNSQVTLTAKAAGAIDTAIPNSPVIITVTAKNYNAATGDYTVEILHSNKKLGIVDQPANKMFDIVPDGNVITITGKEVLKENTEGYTYSARISSESLGAKPATVKLTVKASKKAPAASVTLKAAGSIDILRPGTQVVITPTFKNWYGYDLSKAKLSLDTSLFEYEPVDGKFVIRPVFGADIDPKTSYTVSMTLDSYTTKAVKLPVKMGAVKLQQSVKSLTLLKNDRFDRQSVKLSLDDDTLYGIDGARVELDAKSEAKYSLTKLGSGEYAIGYKDNTLPETVTGSSVMAAAATPDDMIHANGGGGVTGPTGPVDIGGGKPKSDTVKLNVFLTGNGGIKPNQVITVKLKLV